MNNEIKLSVIVSAYNEEKYIEKCLESLLSQTLTGIEFILINDASTDKTLEIMNKYYEKYPDRIRVINLTSNLRQGGARNRGIKAAQGEYVAYCDADDWIDATMYEKLYTTAKKHNADRTACYFTKHNQNNGNVTERKNLRGWTSIIRKEILIKNSIYFPEGITYEDLLFIKILDYYVNTTVVIPEHLYHYRAHSESVTHSIDTCRMHDRLKIELMILDELEKRNLEIPPYSKETQVEFLSRFLLKNCQAWYSKSKQKPNYPDVRKVRDVFKCRVPQYKKILQDFTIRDRIVIFYIMHLTPLFHFLAKFNLIQTNKRQWGNIKIGFCNTTLQSST